MAVALASRGSGELVAVSPCSRRVAASASRPVHAVRRRQSKPLLFSAFFSRLCISEDAESDLDKVGRAPKFSFRMSAQNAVILCTAGYDHSIRFWQAPQAVCYRTLQFADSVRRRAHTACRQQSAHC